MLSLPHIENIVRTWAINVPAISGVWLIGSYALCRAHEGSDLDIVIAMDESITNETAFTSSLYERQSLTESLQSHFSVPVDLYLRCSENKRIELFVSAYGLVLYQKRAISPSTVVSTAE